MTNDGLMGAIVGVGVSVGRALSRNPVGVGVPDRVDIGVGLVRSVPFVMLVGVILGQEQVPEEKHLGFLHTDIS